ncbi:MAG: ATP-binding protein [Peptoniphilus grossensis]|uniref:ATP-binding protein n=1 Tax=Peptoniphilus grossensis TaxID=1465756 RepID=UPI00290942D2|nr:ATP-binding protein [Peptoniphilus grossensis]MDU7151987.1 ATP-binding protein [Peptoniphilus grossensis]
MDTLYKFKGFVNSDLSLIKNFLDSAMKDLNPYIRDQEKLFDIKVILNELVVNGAMHGNKEDLDKKVCLKLILDSDSLKIIVKDEGRGVDFDTALYDCTQKRCNGRGLLIVEALTDQLILNDNEVIAIKNL